MNMHENQWKINGKHMKMNGKCMTINEHSWKMHETGLGGADHPQVLAGLIPDEAVRQDARGVDDALHLPTQGEKGQLAT